MPQKPYRVPGRTLWYGRVDLGTDLDGKRRSRTLSGRTRKEVVEKQVALLREIHTGTALEPSTLTTGAYLVRWVEEVVRPTKAVRTYEIAAAIIRLHLAPRIGTVLLTKLQPAHISAMLAAIQREKSTKTALDAHTILRTALNHAVKKWQLLAQSPIERVAAPRYEPDPPTLWTEEELRAFLAGIRGQRHGVLYRVALDTGLRQAELLGLRWADFDAARGHLAVRRQSVTTETQGQITTPTKGRRGRSITLSPGTVAALVAHHAAQQATREQAGTAWQDEDRIFPNPTGGALTKDALKGAWRRQVARLGLPHAHFHSLRHLHATYLLLEGIHPKIVADRLGHSSTAITMNVYSHVTSGMQAQAAAAFAQTMDRITAPPETPEK